MVTAGPGRRPNDRNSDRRFRVGSGRRAAGPRRGPGPPLDVAGLARARRGAPAGARDEPARRARRRDRRPGHRPHPGRGFGAADPAEDGVQEPPELRRVDGSSTGIDANTLLRTATAAPLPDDHAASALWWRITRHLPPAEHIQFDESVAVSPPGWAAVEPSVTVQVGDLDWQSLETRAVAPNWIDARSRFAAISRQRQVCRDDPPRTARPRRRVKVAQAATWRHRDISGPTVTATALLGS